MSCSVSVVVWFGVAVRWGVRCGSAVWQCGVACDGAVFSVCSYCAVECVVFVVCGVCVCVVLRRV